MQRTWLRCIPSKKFRISGYNQRVYGERKDDWSSALSRLPLALDLPAAEAVYH